MSDESPPTTGTPPRVSLRHLIPYLTSLWILGWPAALYFFGRMSGELPSEAQWNSTAHSSGPWAHDIFLLWCLSFLAALAIHAGGVLFSCSKQQHTWAEHWGAGFLVFLGSAAAAFFFFGYLME